MISQVMEAWEKLWKGVRQSREQKHRRLLESFKETRLKEKTVELEKRFQIRFIIEGAVERGWEKRTAAKEIPKVMESGILVGFYQLPKIIVSKKQIFYNGDVYE